MHVGRKHPMAVIDHRGIAPHGQQPGKDHHTRGSCVNWVAYLTAIVQPGVEVRIITPVVRPAAAEPGSVAFRKNRLNRQGEGTLPKLFGACLGGQAHPLLVFRHGDFWIERGWIDREGLVIQEVAGGYEDIL